MPCAESYPVTVGAAKALRDKSPPRADDAAASVAASSGVSTTESSKDPGRASEAEPVPQAVPDKKIKAPVSSRPKRPFGMTTLAALRQRPQPAALRQKEVRTEAVKAEQRPVSHQPLMRQPVADTGGPSGAAIPSPINGADTVTGLALAEPSSAVASTSSDWNLTQPEIAFEASQTAGFYHVAALSLHGSAAASDLEGATPSADLPAKPHPMLNKQQRHAQQLDQAAVDDASAGPSSSEAADWLSAVTYEPGSAQLSQQSQSQQAQRHNSSRQSLPSDASVSDTDFMWGAFDHSSLTPADQSGRPVLAGHSASGSAADSAQDSANNSPPEFSFGSFAVGLTLTAAPATASHPQHHQMQGLSRNAESWQAESFESRGESSRVAAADTRQSNAESSAMASASVSDDDSTPAAAPVFGQRVAGRGPFQLSTELQMALSGKPKPVRGRAKAALALPEPSADLMLQRALLEKPKPRPRPRRPRVTPQSTGMSLQCCMQALFSTLQPNVMS